MRKQNLVRLKEKELKVLQELISKGKEKGKYSVNTYRSTNNVSENTITYQGYPTMKGRVHRIFTEKARTLTRCRILLLADKGETESGIIKALGSVRNTVRQVCQRYTKDGINAAIYEQPRPGAPNKFSGKQLAQITALACSKAPEGRCRWSLRLLADKVVELNFVEDISYKTIERTLKKTNLSLI